MAWGRVRVGDIVEFKGIFLYVLGVVPERDEALVAGLSSPFWPLALKLDRLASYGPPSDDLRPHFVREARSHLPIWGSSPAPITPPLPTGVPQAAWHGPARELGSVIRFQTYDSQGKLGKAGRPGLVVSSPAYPKPAVVVVPLSFGGERLAREHVMRDFGPAQVEKGTFAQAKLATIPLRHILPPSHPYPLGRATKVDFDEVRMVVDREMLLGLA